MERQIEVIDGTISTLGEGPVWLADEKTFYWVDIMEKQIRFYQPETSKQWKIQADQFVGAAVPATNNRLVCAMYDGLYSLDLATERFEKIVELESNLPRNRFNDGKCDDAGRFWAGTMSMNDEAGAGSLYCLETDGSARKVLTDIGCSNGIGWSPDNQKMYYIDSNTREVHQLSYDLETGEIGNREIIVRLGDGEGLPDGMAVDAEGMIWVAQWDGYCVARWNPNTGEQLDKIELPVSKVTSCCFGGENLDVLYITSARTGLSEEQLSKEPLAGSCFRYVPGVKGLSVSGYKGL